MEETEEDAIEQVLDFLNTIRALKKYAHRLKLANIGGCMTWTKIKVSYDVLIKELM